AQLRHENTGSAQRFVLHDSSPPIYIVYIVVIAGLLFPVPP
ncbi:MAG: hypothetical protein H6Q76_1942, partial [Firmicutes bacterium]|nr:hypothetical protein [Bacillota bacterium]